MKQYFRARFADEVKHDGKTFVPDLRMTDLIWSGQMSFKTVSNIIKRDGTKAIAVNVKSKSEKFTKWIYTEKSKN